MNAPAVDGRHSERLRDGIALAVASFYPLAMSYLYFVVFADQPPEDSTFGKLFGFGKAAQFLFPAAFVWWFYPREFWSGGKHGFAGVGLGVGFAAFVAVGIFGLFFGILSTYPPMLSAVDRIVDKLRQFHAMTPVRYVVMSAFIAVVHAALEEYYWRWYVFGWLRKHLGPTWAIVLSSVGFTLHHIVILGVYFANAFWTVAIPFSLCVGVGGAVWAWIYERTGSLLGPWLSHVLIDTAILIVGFFLVRPHLTG